MRTIEIEYYIARYFGWREHIIVPNVSWGMGLHECDLLIMTKCGYAYEVEIKISLTDLRKDSKKDHRHGMEAPKLYKEKLPLCDVERLFPDKIKYLYFAVPEKLAKYDKFVPAKAGILVVSEGGFVQKLRKATQKSDYQFSATDIHNIARLGTMRIWTLKNQIIKKG